MTKHFWVGLIAGIVICGVVGGLVGISMVGKKATAPPSEIEARFINYLKAMKIPEAPAPSEPIEISDEILFTGGEHYNHHCAVCHDLEGDADSDFAKAFNPPVANLTSEEVQRYSDGQLKWIVDSGIRFTGMPGWKGIIDEATQWKIVYYMRALADSEKAERLKAGLKARGKWEAETPGGDHHHGEGEEHESALLKPEESQEHNHDSGHEH